MLALEARTSWSFKGGGEGNRCVDKTCSSYLARGDGERHQACGREGRHRVNVDEVMSDVGASTFRGHVYVELVVELKRSEGQHFERRH